jgi:hypothetical protein
MHEKDGRARQLVLSYLRGKPRHGATFLKIAFERRYIPTVYVFDILAICQRHEIDTFSFAAQVPDRYAEFDLSIPDGFGISYGDGSDVVSGAGKVKLNMRPALKPYLGEVVLEANGEQLPVVGNGLGCQIPDYEELAKQLSAFKKRAGEMSQDREMRVFLEIDSLVPSYHIGQVINICAGAGITSLTISKP